MKGKSDVLLVSFDHAHGNIPMLVVGRKGKGEIDILLTPSKMRKQRSCIRNSRRRKEKYETTEKINLRAETVSVSTQSQLERLGVG